MIVMGAASGTGGKSGAGFLGAGAGMKGGNDCWGWGWVLVNTEISPKRIC